MRFLRLPGIHHDSAALVVEDAGEAIVIDPGTSWYQVLIAARVETLVSSVPNHIWLTHRHFEVAGAARYLSETWKATIHAHTSAESSLSIGERLTTNARSFDSEMPNIEIEACSGGDVFTVGDAEFEVLHLPGHTSCGIGFYMPSRRLLVSGGVVPSGDRLARWDMPTGSLDELINSLKVIRDLDLELLVPNIGESIEGEDVELVLNSHIELIEGAKQVQGQRPEGWPTPAATCSYLTPPTA